MLKSLVIGGGGGLRHPKFYFDFAFQSLLTLLPTCFTLYCDHKLGTAT